MKPMHKKVLEEALRLPAEARAALAGHLLESLDDAVDEDVELAWSKEIARRIDDLDRGKVKTVPWSVARRQILGRSVGRSKRYVPS
jgi:putative addiction module component (TIGR02574 family)